MAEPEQKWGLTAALLRPEDDALAPYELVEYQAPSERLKPPPLPPLPPSRLRPPGNGDAVHAPEHPPPAPPSPPRPADLTETIEGVPAPLRDDARAIPGPAEDAGQPELPRFANWQVATACAAAVVVGMMIGNATRGTAQKAKSKESSVVAAGPRRATATTAPPTTASTSASTTPSTTVAATPTTAAGTTPGVLLYIQRHVGPMTTSHFNPTGPRWSLGWAYDCTKQGGTGSFKVTVQGADGSPTQDAGVSEQGASGKSVSSYTSTGDRFLVVDTPCTWAIRVTT